MAKISLATYTLRIRKANDIEPLKIDSFSKNADFYDFLLRYISELKRSISHHIDEKRLLKIIDSKEINKRRINGLIESGIYGFTTELYDIKKEKTSYKRSIDEAELIPFYFLFDITAGYDEAIIVLQRFANIGIRKVLLEDIRQRFREDYPEYIIDINPLVPDSFFEEYLNEGRVTKIRFRKFSVDQDIANNFDSYDHKEQIAYTDLVVTAHRNKRLPIASKLRKFQKGKMGLNELFDIKSFAFDKVQIELVKNGNKRMLDLSELNRIRAYYDITDHIKINDNGHPDFEQLNREANILLSELKTALKRG